MDLAGLLDPEQLSERLAFQKRLVDEEAEAAEACERLLSGPSAWWGNAIRSLSPTSGLVRELVERSVRTLQRSPTDALVLAQLAAKSAETIAVTAYPYDHVYRIRGEAQRQEAWVLSILGNFLNAAKVAESAERCFRTSPLPLEIDLARLDLVYANIALGTKRAADAAALADRAGETFRWYGNRRGWVNSCNTRAVAYWHMADYQRALETWQLVHDDLDLMTPEFRFARLHNMAICKRELGDLDGAALFFGRALAEAERHGLNSSAACSRASLGVVLLHAGKIGEAIESLRSAWSELEVLGMQLNATMTALRLVEALLITESFDEVPAICRMLIDRCTKSGASLGTVKALAYLREAVAKGQATPQHVQYVHDFLRDGDAQEQFVPMTLQ